MPRHIAFLRAINVGGHVVKMDLLRAQFESLGFKGVETFIASGNVLFDAPSKNSAALEQRIERSLEEALGYAVTTFIRSPAELVAIAELDPFASREPWPMAHTLNVAFLKQPPASTAAALLDGLRTEMDELALDQRQIYWRCRGGTGSSKLSSGLLEKKLGAPLTWRNTTTVRRLALKLKG